ncbi:hypothetical protein Rctr71_028 [Virus Rctr71]|nr:hypothetical protein Rctr71_028 [Virus Rctr71]
MRYSTDNTRLETWFERDRSYIGLTTEDERDIISLWDDDAEAWLEEHTRHAFVMGKLHHSNLLQRRLCEYVNEMGIVAEGDDYPGEWTYNPYTGTNQYAVPIDGTSMHETLGVVYQRDDGRWDWFRKPSRSHPNWPKGHAQGVAPSKMKAMKIIIDNWTKETQP